MNFDEMKQMSDVELEKIMFDMLEDIEDIDEKTVEEAKKRQENLAKPPGALGLLEDISIRIAGITGQVKNSIEKSVVVICSSDNGVIVEGVTPTPQSVTMAQTINFLDKTTGVGAIAKGFESDLCVIDLGVNAKIQENLLSKNMEDFESKIIDRKIGFGTKNLNIESAMTRKEAILGILAGIEAVKTIKEKGYDIIGTGEMGIGNTTTSACVLSAITKKDANATVGRGGGLNDEGFAKKKEVVNKAMKAEYTDVIDVLSRVGGFDICGIVGVFLGSAIYKMPVVIDGYISAVSALVATKIDPKVKEYMFSSHISKEAGYKIAMDEIGMKGILDLDMRLGEGSGCPLAFQIIKGATFAMNYMATFGEAKIDENYQDLVADAKF